jgi:hypothetical protein
MYLLKEGIGFDLQPVAFITQLPINKAAGDGSRSFE